MLRETKSEKSRRAVLDAGLELFSSNGFRATTVREIADGAGVSTGNVYHHFPDKEAIFRALIDEYLDLTSTHRFPFTRALHETTHFPDNIEELGYAARESIRKFRPYLALIYVDVIEFGGTHIQRFYGEMAARFTKFFEERADLGEIKARLRPNVSPTDALLLTARLFFNYFSLEILFGVAEPFGKDPAAVVEQIADILRNGICAR
ncbi:MAG: TetR/AcrR family transcriptional regulator [Acidobacteria bacterium]|nr:TetR/AcrR family transcriptional regulator [Acidobacteriota bacterium]MBV9475251.1 TetR/AcrR family transcriptional regulator [Acidobacteriota bacterium]